MDDKYYIINTKKKISDLIDHVDKKYSLSQENKDFLIYFSKKIMFFRELYHLKFFFSDENRKYYMEQIISDSFYIINTFLEINSRYFYLNYRSIIEQFCGLFNNVPLSNGRIFVTNELSSINKFINTSNLKNEKNKKIDYGLLKSCYSKACMYIHGNPNAEYLNISFFQEIEDFKNLNDNNKRKIRRTMVNDIIYLFDILIILLSYKYSETISFLFFRRKKILEFYVGKFCCEIIKNYKTIEIIHKTVDNKILGISHIVKDKKDNNFFYEKISIPNYALKNKNDFKEKLYSEADESIYWIWEETK